MAIHPTGAAAEQASQPTSLKAGQLDAGQSHTCALLVDASVRCWGFNGDGQLGYGNTSTIGDDETPDQAGPVNLGVGGAAKAISAGNFHTCVLLNDDSVRCWGFGGNGRLGYGNTNKVGNNATNTPDTAGPVHLGTGRTAKAITTGAAHTCAVLDDDTVRCWGFGFDGRLGYANTNSVGENPSTTPDTTGPVDLGTNRKAKAITSGSAHTCALLDDNTVRCWGYGGIGQLGYGNNENIGDNESPGSVPPVDLGGGRTARAISAGGFHTCALLDDNTVRCWGLGGNGRLGYGNLNTIGDNETPGAVPPVDLGGHGAKAISAGQDHTCALLDDNTVRCWGYAADGQLGYANTNDIGDNETPGAVGPVDLGAGHTAVAISTGGRSTCARLDDGNVRCWGYAANGQLGYCNTNNIGDDETPGPAGPVGLEPGDAGATCASAGTASAISNTTAPTAQVTGGKSAPTVSTDAARARGLRGCLAAVTTHAIREKELARHGSASRRAKARRHATRHASRQRRRCLGVYGRTPGRITGLRAQPLSKTKIELDFNAPGTDGAHPPPARSYLVKQSNRPIRSARDFARAKTLCKESCRFTPSRVGAKVSLTVTDLRPSTTYYYAISARDNVSAKRGPRSPSLAAKTH